MHFTACISDPGGDARDNHGDWLLCGAGSLRYAVPLARVVEVTPLLRIDSIAGAPSWVLGLSIIRGSPTPVVDVAFLFDGASGPCQRFVTVKAGTGVIALAVEKVLGVRAIEADGPMPPLLRDAAGDMASAIGRLDAELLLFLGTARLIPEALVERLDNLKTVA